MVCCQTSTYGTCLLACFCAFALCPSIEVQAQPPGGGPGSPDKKLVEQFDDDGDGMLNAEERKAARKHLADQPQRGRRPNRRFAEPGKPGPRVTADEVENYPDHELFDPTVLRTFFLEFENDDWEQELAVFKPTDVEVPATLKVDGKTYPNVGVSFRGASSFFMVPEGLKRSLNLSIDFGDKDQRLYGYKSLNLLNGMGDASLMSSALYSQMCSQHIATPKVNYVRVVINDESWGLYVSSQQFNKVFTNENFSSSKGARWKVSGSPRGDGGLRYLGDDLEPYRERFEIKSKDNEKSWRDLIKFCQVLNETPVEELETALEPILDIDGALWFLAVDVVLSNSDGYWTRASDYSIYQDTDGKFHILPHDMNEAFRMGRGRGGPRPPRGGVPKAGGPPEDKRGRPPEDRGGPPKKRGDKKRGGPPPPGRQRGGPRGGFGGGGGPTLDPLTGLDDPRKPLRSKLLSNPKLQLRYLEHVRSVTEMLKWENLGPRIEQIRTLIEDDIAKDTRKLSSVDAFRDATSSAEPSASSTGLRAFAERRSKFLLNHAKIKSLPPKSSR